MHTSDYQLWKQYSPLTYNYLSIHQIPDISKISSSKFCKRQIKSSQKHTEYRAYIAGRDSNGNGYLSLYQLNIPLVSSEVRLKPQLHCVCCMDFEREITVVEECVINSTLNANLGDYVSGSESFLAVAELMNPQIMIYPSKILDNTFKEKRLRYNPRLTLKGHTSNVITLKSCDKLLLSGCEDGQLKIYDLNSGQTQSQSTYKYHQNAITDCCWLAKDGSDKCFATASKDQTIYLWDRRAVIPCSKISPKQGEVNSIEHLSDNCLISGGQDGTVKFWDVRVGQHRCFTYKECVSPVRKLQQINRQPTQTYTYTNPLFASGSEWGEVMLWEEDALFCHLPHAFPISDLSFEPSTEMLMASDKCTVSLWKPAIFNQL